MGDVNCLHNYNELRLVRQISVRYEQLNIDQNTRFQLQFVEHCQQKLVSPSSEVIVAWKCSSSASTLSLQLLQARSQKFRPICAPCYKALLPVTQIQCTTKHSLYIHKQDSITIKMAKPYQVHRARVVYQTRNIFPWFQDTIT